jgi:long-subunit acyl-CoA synthetase (AMP-forming)
MKEDKNRQGKITPPEKDIGTMFFERVERYGDRPIFTYKHEGRWKDISWFEAAEVVQDVALGLMELEFKYGDMACILSQTRVEWAYCYLGLASVGGICAGIYATNSPSQVQYILNDSRATLLCAEEQEHVDKGRCTVHAFGKTFRIGEEEKEQTSRPERKDDQYKTGGYS